MPPTATYTADIPYIYPAAMVSGCHRALSLQAQFETEQVPRSPEGPQEPTVYPISSPFPLLGLSLFWQIWGQDRMSSGSLHPDNQWSQRRGTGPPIPAFSSYLLSLELAWPQFEHRRSVWLLFTSLNVNVQTLRWWRFWGWGGQVSDDYPLGFIPHTGGNGRPCRDGQEWPRCSLSVALTFQRASETPWRVSLNKDCGPHPPSFWFSGSGVVQRLHFENH